MMKRPLRNRCSYMIYVIVIGLSLWTTSTVHGSCTKAEKKLWAYGKPSVEHFTDTYKKYLSSEKGERCRWVIIASDEEDYVKLSFSKFALKNSTKSEEGDCVDIYDDDGTKLDQLCDKIPREMYTSKDRTIYVIYRRGEVEGDRQFTMTYSSISAVSSEKYIKIAGIVGAVLAGAGLVFVALKVTRCCRCLRKRKANTDIDHNGSTTRTRLVQNVRQIGHNSDTVQNNTPSQNRSQPSGASALSPSTLENDETAAGSAHHSDTDSLQDMNEPPPSYESLYLDEQGEPLRPPKYSPPEHRATHPPRRANTVN